MSEVFNSFRHQMMDGGSARIQTAVGGEGPPLVLIHGLPQTWWEWRSMLPRLTKTNTVVAVDLSGAGQSGCPHEGYDKATMAADVHGVMLALGFERYAVCGHDMGAMVALALAVAHRNAVTRLAVLDASQPSWSKWEANCAKPGFWRPALHQERDLAERPPVGRKYDYVSTFTFVVDHAFHPDAQIVEGLQVSAGALAQPVDAHGGLEWSRAFSTDHRNTQTRRQDGLAIPVLALGGDHNYGPTILALLEAFAENVSGGGIADCAHWLPEERPSEIADALVEFLK